MAGAPASREDVRSLFQNPQVDVPKPLIVDGDADLAQGGRIETDIKRGSLFLRRDKSDYRVLFNDTNDGARALEPGTYDWFGYRLLKKGDDGAPWFVSTAGPRGVPLEIVDGETLELSVDSKIETVWTAKNIRQGLVGLTLTILGTGMENRPSLTVYRDGKRVAASYEVLDLEGNVLTSGPLSYG